MDFERINTLVSYVEAKPIAILRIAPDEWQALRDSRQGISEFTLPVLRQEVSKLHPPTLCILAAGPEDGEQLMMGVVGRPSVIATAHSRIKLKRVFRMEPPSLKALVAVLDAPIHIRALSERVRERARVTMLTPKPSAHLVERLAMIEANDTGMRAIAASLSAPRTVRGNAAFEDMGLRTALRAFGLSPEEPADRVELMREDETVLSRIPLREDAVIEHDARWMRGLDLEASDLTGRALFTRGDERLEVFTANRRSLENALGVDLVYYNETRGNVVMVQYKMLEPRGSSNWTYRPDDQLQAEIARMKGFDRQGYGGVEEYRLNSSVFYLKFVKRNAALRQGGILMPLEHYETFSRSRDARGERGGLRIDYEALQGRYLREQPFADLVRAGYIGAYARDSRMLRAIVQNVIDRGGAVVAAIQYAIDRRHR